MKFLDDRFCLAVRDGQQTSVNFNANMFLQLHFLGAVLLYIADLLEHLVGQVQKTLPLRDLETLVLFVTSLKQCTCDLECLGKCDLQKTLELHCNLL
eukprot:Skav204815  [mRNA]  locus=scaffold3914:91536:92819:+ [translate_table: standard]